MVIENIEQMQERHEREIVKLQVNCPHKNKKIHIYIYGPLMHGGSYEDYCEDCGKTLAIYKVPAKMVELSPNHFSWAYGEEERIETDKEEKC